MQCVQAAWKPAAMRLSASGWRSNLSTATATVPASQLTRSSLTRVHSSFGPVPSVQNWIHRWPSPGPMAALPTDHQPIDVSVVGIRQLDGHLFHHRVRLDILHRCVVYERAQRRGIEYRNQLGRGEMAGSRRKMRPQKRTGRARVSDRFSPLFHGGAKAWPRKTRDHRIQLNAKVREFGMRSALSSKFTQNQLVILDGLPQPPSDDDAVPADEDPSPVTPSTLSGKVESLAPTAPPSNVTPLSPNAPTATAVGSNDQDAVSQERRVDWWSRCAQQQGLFDYEGRVLLVHDRKETASWLPGTVDANASIPNGTPALKAPTDTKASKTTSARNPLAVKQSEGNLPVKSRCGKLMAVEWQRLRVEDILKYDYLVLTRRAVTRLETRYATY